jgi:hypothetical protein
MTGIATKTAVVTMMTIDGEPRLMLRRAKGRW